MMGNGSGSDERDVSDLGMRRQMRCNMRPAGDQLNEIRILSACSQCSLGDPDKVLCRPACLLRAFDNRSVARKDGRNDGVQEIMELP